MVQRKQPDKGIV